MLGSVTNCWKEEDWIGGCLDLLDVDIKVVVMSDLTYSGAKYDPDKSEQIAKEKGARVLKLNTDSQEIMRNAALEFLQKEGCEYAIIADADEWWTKRAMETVKKAIGSGKPGYKVKMRTMFRRPDWEAISTVDGGTLVAVRTDLRFFHRRALDGDPHIEPVDAEIFHFSYAKKPEQIRRKLLNFSHADEVIPGWFENVFLPFEPKRRDFHPTVPTSFRECRTINLPKEICEKLQPAS
ncbi:MAG: hypothetical protein PHF35_04795 [Candidatus Moranbacteria bacterium]|nr:hypothetical protein [Candidatus Moranbacteria bacterium]